MGYDLDDAMELTISRAAALREIRRHGCMVQEFFDEVGDRDEYTGAEVLIWLGY